ncbi:ty3-gypsy retroelement transposase [Cucumis melo var. makuwa]|uniref:Ty3-gypsy retroelement transposase n=1 Tax=Cucumis melo var. makuwa TaxID=1194695 RepID=A0A5D3E295_CUCMM|nr:ty3-gypsy retroelement transposase [Cucumis melo var. makuwa]TYK29908.1 ty3-gypsy retroelement transposase [Cucumis melo var. makuwa]
MKVLSRVDKYRYRKALFVGFTPSFGISKGLEEHIQHLELVLEILRANELYANLGPLTQLLKNGSFKWNEEATASFEQLKKAMMTLPVLAIPDFNLPFKIKTDASGYGVGRWRPYLLGRKFVVKTDQRSLKFLLEQRVIQPQYQKWIAKLLGYSFEVDINKG